MAVKGNSKPPVLDLAMCENKQESVELWIDQFNYWCVLQDWRDLSKGPREKEHWKVALVMVWK